MSGPKLKKEIMTNKPMHPDQAAALIRNLERQIDVLNRIVKAQDREKAEAAALIEKALNADEDIEGEAAARQALKILKEGN